MKRGVRGARSGKVPGEYVSEKGVRVRNQRKWEGLLSGRVVREYGLGNGAHGWRRNGDAGLVVSFKGG